MLARREVDFGTLLPPLFDTSRYLLGAVVGAAGAGGVCGRAGAAPVVIPGSVLVLVRGVTSRMPVGAAGGEVRSVFCAVDVVGVVPAWLTVELFSP